MTANTNCKRIPTNIITGFLGSGKTTAILNVLKAKPSNERWAVLVNEFGEVGIDGAMLDAVSGGAESNIHIKEVPGGCMCCASGLPMAIALNQLIARSRPDRLLIEPSGLGHPKEVIETLMGEHYREVLEINQTLTLVDARKIGDKRYRTHETFQQQIEVADVIIASKADLYHDADLTELESYLGQNFKRTRHVEPVRQGKLSPSLLNGHTAWRADLDDTFENESNNLNDSHQHDASHHHARTDAILNERELPESGILSIENQGQGFKSAGWRFSSAHCFDYDKLHHWMSGLNVDRLKAVMITNEGIFIFNLVDSVLTQQAVEESYESRIEIINDDIDPSWSNALKTVIVEGL